MEPKYPEVSVRLVGEDGNAFSIIGRVREALRRAKIERGEIDAFMAEAMSGDYDHLLQTVLAWVSVEEPEDEDEDWNEMDLNDKSEED